MRKLSFKEQRELEALPGLIEKLEQELDELQSCMGDSSFYQQDKDIIAAATTRLQQVESELAEKYGLWEALEALANGEAW